MSLPGDSGCTRRRRSIERRAVELGILEEVDLVSSAKVGRARECRLGPAQLEEEMDWIDEYRRIWQSRLDRFGGYVEARKTDRG